MRLEEAEPRQVLPYAPPQPRAPKRDLVLGIIISFCVAMGSGWMIFGLLMMNGQRDDHAGPFAVGVGLVVLGFGLTGTMLWLRRHPR